MGRKSNKQILEEVCKEEADRILKKFDKIMIKEFGKKCSDYNKDCILCRIYRVYEKFKGDFRTTYINKNGNKKS